MNEIGIAWMWCAVQITLLGAAATGVYLVARRLRPSAGSLVLLTSLLLIVGLSLTAFSPWPRWSAMAGQPPIETVPPETTIEAEPPGAASEIETEAPTGMSPAAPSSLPTTSPVSAFWDAFVAEMSSPGVPSESSPGQWPSTVAIVLLVAAGLGLLWIGIGLVTVRAYRLRSRPVREPKLLELVDVLCAELGCRRPIELREFDGLVTASTFGWRRPVVLLPSDWPEWSDQQRRVVLAHEIAHVAHNDFPAALCGQLGLVLHFYHPLVHWLVGQLRLEQELAADDAAAKVAGGRVSYLKTLAEMALRRDDQFVVWPARTFLPTRKTFLRRIEMLRRHKLSTGSLSAGLRAVVIGGLLLLGLTVAGLRGPARDVTAAAEEGSPVAERAESSKAVLGLDHVTRDALGLIRGRPAELARHPALKELADFLGDENEYVHMAGISLERIEEVLIVFLRPVDGRAYDPLTHGAYLVFRTAGPDDCKQMAEAKCPETNPREIGGKTCRIVSDLPASYRLEPWGYYQIDDRTIVFGDVSALREYLTVPKGGPANIAKLPIWDSAERAPVVVAADVAGIVGLIDRNRMPTPMQGFAPLWKEPSSAGLVARLNGNRLRVEAVAVCSDDQGAQQFSKTAEAAKTFGENLIEQSRKAMEGRRSPSPVPELLALDFIEPFVAAVRVHQKGALVRVETQGELDGKTTALLADMIRVSRAAARRAQSLNNLKHIGLGMLNHESARGAFLSAASYDADGKPLLSWRVHILPYMEAVDQELYDQFHLDEPWDSPHNIKLLPKMPTIYRSADAKHAEKYYSSYFVLTGPTTVFPREGGVSVKDLAQDGTSHTLLAVEADRPVPWTKPEDIPYDPDKPLPKLGGLRPGLFNILFCDGSVHVVAESIDEQLLRSLIEKADGRSIDPIDNAVDPQRPLQRPLPRPGGAPPLAL